MVIGSPVFLGRGARAATPRCLLLLAVLTLFVTAPKHDDFWWTDAPTHAMNGALLHDYLLTSGFTSPLRFATDYFMHYPALTITLYPPVFAVTEAVVFLATGVSHFAAQLTVALFALLFAYSLYRSTRSAFSPAAAVGAALLVLSTPGVALWSRQVMIEIPALALLTTAAAVFLRFLEEGAAKRLYLSVVLLCGAVYTKQTMIFAAAAFPATLLLEQGWAALRRRSTWVAAVLGLVLLVPIGVFTVVFDPFHVEVVSGVGREAGSNFAISSWFFYLRALLRLTGPVPIAAALGYLALVAWKGWASAQERRLALLMIAWFAADYLFISVIAHREVRYGIFLTVPLATLAIGLVKRLLPRTLAAGTGFVIGAVAFVVAIAVETPPRVTGYDAVAAYLLAHTDQNGVVLFHGYRSQNLVFSLRAQSATPRLYLLRSEKMLVNYRISREFGGSDRGLARADMEKLVDRLGIVYVVFQPDFWTDLPSVAALQDFVYSDRFTKVAEFPIGGDVSADENEILIFRNNRPTHPLHPTIELNMPLLGGRISGNY